MAQTTDINGIPWPELGDEPNIEAAVKPAVEHIDSRIIPRYATTSERDGAIPTPENGQACYVTGVGFQLYEGSWVTIWGTGVPSVKVYRSADSGGITHNTAVAVAFDTELWDTAGMHSTSSATSRLVAPIAGKYVIEATVTWSGNATGFRQYQIRKNAAGSASGGEALVQHRSAPNDANNFDVYGSDTIELAANDYVEVFGMQFSGVNTPVIRGGQTNTCAALTYIGR